MNLDTVKHVAVLFIELKTMKKSQYSCNERPNRTFSDIIMNTQQAVQNDLLYMAAGCTFTISTCMV